MIDPRARVEAKTRPVANRHAPRSVWLPVLVATAGLMLPLSFSSFETAFRAGVVVSASVVEILETSFLDDTPVDSVPC
jgi:hypothetical protein